MKDCNELQVWLDILNDVSCFLEDHIAEEKDKDRIIQLDRVINGVYNLIKQGGILWVNYMNYKNN